MAFTNISAGEVLFSYALNVEMRRFQIWVRDNEDFNILLLLDSGYFSSLFVKQESGYVRRHLSRDLRRRILHGFFFKESQDGKRRWTQASNRADAVATWADFMTKLGQ